MGISLKPIVTGPLDEAIPARLAPASDRRALLLLVAIAALVRLWIIAHATTVAPDGYGFIALARRLGNGPFLEVLCGMEHHPVYPAWLLLVSWVVRAFGLGHGPSAWELSGQLASGLAGVATVPLFYHLGKLLFNRPVAFWSTLLFNLLPVPVRVSADCLSDATYAFFAVAALASAAHAVERRRPYLAIVSALACGLAYLTRPEGLLVGLVALVFLAGSQCVRALRWERRDRIIIAALAAAAGAWLIAPYAALKGGLSAKQTWQRILGQADAPHARPLGAALADLVGDFDQASLHVFDWFAVVGVFAAWRERWRRPSHRLMGLLLAGSLAGLVLVSVRAGYVSQRHTMTPLIVTMHWTALGLLACARELAGRISLRGRGEAAGSRASARLAICLVLAVLSCCVPSLFRPMHRARAAHLEAARWLADRMAPGEAAVDLCGVASLHSERPCYGFYHFEAAARDGLALRYVVAEENDFRPTIYIEQPRLRQLLDGARLVASFPAASAPRVNRVLVYELRRASRG